ncbi:hypothetical protein SAMN05421743_101280 [Thalassobacillus cyri]|uniref:Uncharacterized protein n=1 Tax=Thalassobacillus cyri TaxID=571932 RepID=A0A1H3W1C9_9BACI|nr:hypothetical protein [Thalassobacillus cyri]SDZ80839.1 hypothetical protein SAMN05421743_101280 [Thalassobacillus cyri]
MKLSRNTKKGLVTIHLLFAAIMFGATITLILLSGGISATDDAQVMQRNYEVMHLISTTIVRGSTFATIITGILLSMMTPWGLFKFYWIIAKEVLSLILFTVNIWGMSAWTNRALQQINNTQDAIYPAALQVDLWIGLTIQLVSLILIYGLSVYKPWGKKKSGG